MRQPVCPARDFGTCSFSNSSGPYLCVFCGTAQTLFAPAPNKDNNMNHKPIPTDTLPVTMVKMVPLSKVLEAIGHPDMGDDETDAFADISFGDAAFTLCSGWRLFDMIDSHLASEGLEDGTYTGEQSDRIRDFLHKLAELEIYIDMES